MRRSTRRPAPSGVGANMVDLGGLTYQGKATITGQPLKPVRIELPQTVILLSPTGAEAELRDFRTDLPGGGDARRQRPAAIQLRRHDIQQGRPGRRTSAAASRSASNITDRRVRGGGVTGVPRPILRGMRMFNLKHVSPIEGIGGFVDQWRQPTPIPLANPGVVGSADLHDDRAARSPRPSARRPPSPTCIWINSWPENRSEKEIVASNIANQKRKDAEAALDKEREEVRKNFYRKLARASGMDPDELAREFGQPKANPAPSRPPRLRPSCAGAGQAVGHPRRSERGRRALAGRRRRASPSARGR